MAPTSSGHGRFCPYAGPVQQEESRYGSRFNRRSEESRKRLGKAMKIAVITPTKPNRAQLLEECRASVREQTRAADTHAVAIDGTLEGPSAVRNRLILELPPEYDWVAFLDDDDVMLPDHLKVLSSASEGADVIYSLCQIECNT